MLLKYFLYFFTIKAILCKSVQISVPSSGDVYEAGHAMLIEWYAHHINATINDPVTIVLASGAAENLTIDRVITNKTSSLLGYYSWIIPKNIPPRNDYVIEVGTTADDIDFAGYITIENKNDINTVNGGASTASRSLPTPVQKPTTSILTAYSPTRTTTHVPEPKETTIFLNNHH